MYEYTPLDSSTSTIRLVILLPGEFGEDVECTLLHVPLDTKLSYEALSYTWGDLKMLHPILLDDQTFPVMENLYDTLRHLRLKNDQVRYLWIDALCMYSYRTAMKHLGNLRFMPQFSEGFDLESRSGKNLCSAPPPPPRYALRITCAPNLRSLPFSFRKGSEAALIWHVTERQGNIERVHQAGSNYL